MTTYNYVPDGKGGYLEVPATPEPQSIAVKAGKAKAYLTDAEAKHIAATTPPAPAVQVTTVDGVPTIIGRPNTPAAAATLVPDEELEALGLEVNSKFAQCEFPGCKGEGRYQIVSTAGKPVSINRKGELVFGERPPVPHAGMTAADKARAQAGAPPAGIVGPSGLVGQQMAKFHLDVCFAHQTLPHAPKAPPKRYRSGPYASYFSAARRAEAIKIRTGSAGAAPVAANVDGAEVWYVVGDDGSPGWSGKLERTR